MDQHPIPRQITTFEFKLIGFMTIKQFIYLVIALPLSYIVFVLFPIPLFNVLFAAVVALSGLALAFLPINDRPLEVWVRNLFKRLTSPTQYLYHKQNQPIYFLENLFFASDPHLITTHIDSQEKLANYLAKTQSKTPSNKNKQTIDELLRNPNLILKNISSAPVVKQPLTKPPPSQKPVETVVSSAASAKKPFFTGVVKNHRLIPLPGILIYVKDEAGNVVRLLKTNPHGVFATFSPLSAGTYSFEIRDPKNIYFFDTMKINIKEIGAKPLEFYSKEML